MVRLDAVVIMRSWVSNSKMCVWIAAEATMVAVIVAGNSASQSLSRLLVGDSDASGPSEADGCMKR